MLRSFRRVTTHKNCRSVATAAAAALSREGPIMHINFNSWSQLYLTHLDSSRRGMDGWTVSLSGWLADLQSVCRFDGLDHRSETHLPVCWLGLDGVLPACLPGVCLPTKAAAAPNQLLCPSRNNNIVSDRRWFAKIFLAVVVVPTSNAPFVWPMSSWQSTAVIVVDGQQKNVNTKQFNDCKGYILYADLAIATNEKRTVSLPVQDKFKINGDMSFTINSLCALKR